MSLLDKSARLGEFTTWVAAHVKGDEKGEAQVFLDRLFQAFGHKGLMEAGATCEMRLKNDTGGTSFADLVWKPIVVIEMKKRGADLSKHYAQAFTYWQYLVPNRPRYAVLCNFDQFWIYDFDSQLDTPVDTIELAALPSKYGPLNFLYPGDLAPVFGNHQEQVTRKVADHLATCFRSMVKRGVERALAQRFILQMLVAFFAEDIDLLERYFVVNLLAECKKPQDTYDLLGGLFVAMNTPGGVTGGRYKGVKYFNGGLFANPARVELVADERALLKAAADYNWATVRPEIFGTIFEHSLEAEERHAFGAHFTSPVDIMKIVGPTIVEPWTQAIESAKTLTRLNELLVRLENFTVLDPACGSGNFLYTAYRELKKLEARIYERMAAEYASVDPKQRPLGFLTTRNFFGMDINSFAVDLAKVTMMLAHKLSIDELHINEAALPLDNLDANFRIGDALINPDDSRAEWFATDVIIGNPPFLGAKLLKPLLGVDYMNRVRKQYPEVPGMADLCVYWFRRAAGELKVCTVADPFAGRAGLVGTQNIRNNASRVGGLDFVVKTGTIIEAVDSQPWSGEANVNVSIVNWVKTQTPSLLPPRKRLWFKVPPSGAKVSSPKGAGPASKRYALDMREVQALNSSLSDKADVATAVELVCNTKPKRVFQGVAPGHEGFMLTPEERALIVVKEATAAGVIFPFLGGDEILSGITKAKRYVIDFQQRDMVQASGFSGPFSRVQSLVLPQRMKAATEGKNEKGDARSHHEQFLAKWWQLSWGMADLRAAIAGLPRYMACSRVTKRPIFAFVDASVLPGDSLQVFAFADDYSFGILQASPHQQWFIARSSKLTERLRYTPDSVFDTFAWPQAPNDVQIAAVAKASTHLRSVQAELMAATKGGLRALYKTFELPGKHPLKDAHAALDTVVLDAYGFSVTTNLLQQLLDLNHAVAAKIATGQEVTAPGIPPSCSCTGLTTNDRIGA